MEAITFKIKNMVCPRCIKVVREDLEKLGLEVVTIQLGQVVVRSRTAEIDRATVQKVLESEGFELLEDRQAVLVEGIKTVVIELIYSGAIEHLKGNFSEYLSQTLHKDYHSISVAFSAAMGLTVEKYFILQKVERAKELLSYDELTLSALAHKLGYSSIAHFSNQFKQITGISPTTYRKNSLDAQNRKFIDGLG